MERFVIVGATVVAGPEMDVLQDAYVQVDKSRVVAVGQGDSPVSAAGSQGEARASGGTFQRVDGRGWIVAPSFVNAHTHIGDVVAKEAGFGLPSWDVVMPPDGVKVRVLREAADDALVAAIRDATRVMLASGTTTFADFREGGAHGAELLRQATEGSGVRAIAFGRHGKHPPHDEADLEANRGGLSPELVEEMHRMLDTLPGWSVPLAFDVTDQGLRDTAEHVRGRGKLLATHCVETDRYRQICRRRFGDGDVERVVKHLKPDHIVHMTSGTDEEFDLVARAGIPVVVAPRMQSVMGIGLAPVDRMVKAGVTVALGSDNGMLASPNLLKEMEFLSRATRAARHDPSFPSPKLLLQMATIHGARALGMQAELGSIEAGKRADLVVFDATSANLRGSRDVLASITHRAETSDVRCVLRDGAVVHGVLAEAVE
jgi:cytosine/adenosine deaminase-related metal-dependent hydrolase